ncbi:MAG: hypothetical protein J7L52_06085 [Thermotogae bacterium]|nr:hypothetical protein [Thermotogota bacterium]
MKLTEELVNLSLTLVFSLMLALCVSGILGIIGACETYTRELKKVQILEFIMEDFHGEEVSRCEVLSENTLFFNTEVGYLKYVRRSAGGMWRLYRIRKNYDRPGYSLIPLDDHLLSFSEEASWIRVELDDLSLCLPYTR